MRIFGAPYLPTLTMDSVDVPGIHGYENAGSSDGEVNSGKETSKQPKAKKRNESDRHRSKSPSVDSDDGKKRRPKESANDDGRKRRRREEKRRRHTSSESEDVEKRDKRRDGRHGNYRRDHDRSRSRSKERYQKNSSRYDRQEDYQSRSRRQKSRSPDRERKERRQRESDRQRDDTKANRDLYWNKYEREERHDKERRSDRRRRESENEDPNSHVSSGKESRQKKDAGGEQETDAANKKKAGDNEGSEALTMRTGGAYIPPARLRLMQASLTDKESAAYQRFAWEALKKSINGLINKVNVSNIGIIVRELFKENIIRGRGLLARSIMQAQAASPTFTHVYAALVSIINCKFPQIGELILTRLVLLFRRGFRRNNKDICLSATRFIAHLVNQQVAHELVALEILYLLFQSPTNDSVEVAIGFLKECGAKLTEVAPKGIHGIFDRLRSILHEGQLEQRVFYMIEVMFAIRKDGFKDHPSVLDGLDLVEEEEQFTHRIFLEDVTDGEDILNVFKHDSEYGANEEKYKTIRKEILDESSDNDESGGSGTESSSEEEDEDGDGDQTIVDNTETNLISLRRTIYLTIQSSLEYEECAHKLLKMELKPGQEVELCHMILDCCAQQRTYEKFYGLLAQRFCQLNKAYVEPFETIFRDSYDTIHRLETNKLRNVAKLFAHLIHTDAINWTVLRHIKLNEEDTTSSSRIFIKILFQELSEYMGLPKLNKRVKDATLQEAFAGLFPRDNPCSTRFAINFFTSIGLGGLTDELREHLKSQPKTPIAPPPPASISSASSTSSTSSSSSSSSSSSDDDSS